MGVMMSWSALIVDDSSALRLQLRAMLESRGVKVVEAENGSEGLWRAREYSVDVIIADIHMPVMDGVRMIREIRMLQQHTNTPIFVLSTDAASNRLEEGRKAGATAWLIKPLNPELLWKGIEKALLQRRPSASAGKESSK
jgi:two-component system chemotaxis response regulator CheY